MGRDQQRTGAKRGSNRELQSRPRDNKFPSALQLYRATLSRATASHTEEEISQWSADEAVARIERIDAVWQKFEQDWSQLGQQQLSADQITRYSKFFAEAEEEYLAYKAKLRNRLQVEAPISDALPTPGGSQAIQIQLTEAPKVPKFSGLEADWANFRAVYEAEVHKNAKFSDAQKMRYLLGALQGRAEQIYKHWPIADGSSYKELWEEMTKQYGNEYNTIRAHLQTLSAMKQLQQPSCDAMRKMLDAARNAFRQLKLLLTPEAVGEHMVLHRLEQMLDQDSRVQWSGRRSAEELPTLDDMFQFLEVRASLLSQMPAANTHGAAQSNRAAGTLNERGYSTGRGDEPRPICGLCPGQYHWPFKCGKFKALPMPDRLTYLIKQNRCNNCFSSRHHAAKCPDDPCPRCRQKHNSVLCPANSNVSGALATWHRLQREAGAQQTVAKQVATTDPKT